MLSRKVLGPEHPNTLTAMGNLASFYGEVEALKIEGEALALLRKMHGPEHRETLGAMTNLAWYSAAVGRLDEAVKMQEESLAIKRRVLHPTDPWFAAALKNMADLYEKTNRRDEALMLREEVLALRRKVLGPDSPVVRSVIVAPSSEWKWLHPTNGVDPKEDDPDFHQTFFTADFDAAAWQTGKDSAEAGGGFGYGDDWFTGVDIGTPGVADEEGKRDGKSAYFRHRFTTTEEHANLELRCQRDDGIIIYLDGKEVTRDNMAEGAEAYALPAASAVGSDAERTTYRIPLPDFTLPAGEHVLAISLHNTEKPSSDLRIGGITLVEVEPSPPDAAPPALAKTREIERLEEVLSPTLLINDDDHPYTLDAKAKLAAALRANGDQPAAAKLEKEITASKARAPAGDE